MSPFIDGFAALAWTQLWQTTFAIIAVGLITRTTCRRRPHLAHMLWLLVLIKCLTPPVWHAPTSIFGWATPTTSAHKENPTPADTVASAPEVHVENSQSSRVDAPTSIPVAESIPAATVMVASNPDRDPPEQTAATPPLQKNHTPVAAIAGALWLLGVLTSAGVMAVATSRCVRRIRAGRVQAGEAVTSLADRLRKRLGIRRRVRLWITRESLGPLTFGCLRPTIVLPEAIVAAHPLEDLEPLLAHELVHVRRGDALVGLLQALARCIWWFHPLVWWANRRMTYECERCCDEEVVAALACPPARYARSLVSLLEIKRHGHWPLPLPGLRPLDMNKRRLEHVMRNASRFRKRMPRAYWLALLGGVLLLVPGASRPANPTADPASEATIMSTQAPERKVTTLISPDGKRIAYGQVAVGPDGRQAVRIIVGNTDGSERRALPVEAESVDEVQWYGNDKIAYVTEHGQDGYFLMDLEGKAAGRLTMPPGCDSFFHQCLSPDGRSIAYCGNYANIPADQARNDQTRRQYLKAHPEIEQTHGLFVVDLERQTVKHVLPETVANLPAWSADSQHLAAGIGHYVAKYPLVIVDVETGEARKPETQGVGVAWSRDGKTLAMVNHIVAGGSWGAGIPMDGRLVAYDIATAQETLLSPPGTNVSVKEPYSWTLSGSHGPVWSADGQWLAYRRSESARREGQEPEYRQEVWIVRRDGTDARKVLNHGASALAWTPGGKALLWVSEGRFGRIEPEIDTTALGPTPAAPAGAFTIHGRVTGADGQPMPGVEVRVARGMGTLHSTTPVATDADGRYEIHFGPAVFSAGGPNMQAACVFAHKPGYYEKDLCQAGNLGMANYQPEGDGAKGWGFAGIVYPGHPYRLDFTMLPAATVSVRLVDREGNPLAKHRLYLAGADLYPASSVLAGGETDAEGRMDLESVPLKTYHFSLTAGRAEINSDPIPFDTPAPLHFRLTYDDIAGTLTAERD